MFRPRDGEGLEALRKAAALDGSIPVIRSALLNALVEQARSVLGQDWRAAEPLVQQALRIDGGHPLAKSLQGLVLDYKRKEIVDESVSQARELQAAGDISGALKKVDEAVLSFPNEVRLAQLRATLRKLLLVDHPIAVLVENGNAAMLAPNVEAKKAAAEAGYRIPEHGVHRARAKR